MKKSILTLLIFSILNSLAVLNAQDCNAAFEYTTYDGSLPSLGGITFTNTSTGDYTNLTWNFGDENFSSDASSDINHFYANGGEYEVCLTIWNGDDEYSISNTCTTLTVSLSDNSCDLSNCVYPGDANMDGQANLFDLLNIGMGIGANGPVRENASCEWNAQAAADWDQETPNGVNYKHLDCDGDGLIELTDISWIQCNYLPMESQSSLIESDGPIIKLNFDVDTVWMDESTPSIIEFSAGLMLGDNDLAFEDIFGLALYMEYESAFLDPDVSIEMNYNGDNFLGNQTEVIPYAKDMKSEGQLDLAFVRMDNQNSSGYGRLATLDFSTRADIIIDIIDGRTDEHAAFSLPISGVQVLNADGESIPISLNLEPSQIVFVKNLSTAILDPALANQVSIYPNPVSELLQINLGQLHGESINLYNTLGQLLLTETFDNPSLKQLNVQNIQAGIYFLKIQTEEGFISKRIRIK